MARYKFLIATIFTSSIISISTAGVTQESSSDQCGEAPAKPGLVNGAMATMDELVANSKEVNGFIAEADDYLDCREALVKDRTNGLSKSARDDISDSVSELTAQRNEIGDLFNAQVAAFKEANPN